jgi:hypothetical protein
VNRTCAACGAKVGKNAQRAYFRGVGGELSLLEVCPECEKNRVVRFVFSAVESNVAIRPFVAHLRKIAKAYEKLGKDDRHLSLQQAADILESGKVPSRS